MNKTNTINKIISLLPPLLVITAFVLAAIGCINQCSKRNTLSSSPIEDMQVIDSIKIENNKIIIEVNNLDSIKDAKIIEVKDLDNDSTLKLFYQLISK